MPVVALFYVDISAKVVNKDGQLEWFLQIEGYNWTDIATTVPAP